MRTRALILVLLSWWIAAPSFAITENCSTEFLTDNRKISEDALLLQSLISLIEGDAYSPFAPGLRRVILARLKQARDRATHFRLETKQFRAKYGNFACSRMTTVAYQEDPINEEITGAARHIYFERTLGFVETELKKLERRAGVIPAE